MSIWSRVANVFRGDRVSGEIDEEFAAHLEEAVAEGRDPVEARRAFGSALRQREESRDARVIGWMDSLRADVVFGWRQLWKRKVTAAAAVLSLGLAIGSCVAAFRLVDALFLRPLPIAHSERLYEVQYSGVDESGEQNVDDGSAYPEFVAMHDAVKGQAELIGASDIAPADLTFGGDDEMEKAGRQYVSGRMFAAFGLKPVAGRLLSEEDDRVPGASPYAVLSYDYWTRRFGRDPKVVGRTFHMNEAVYEIVGVAPKGFTGTQPGTMADVFVPMMMNGMVKEPESQWFRTYMHANPGVAIEILQSRMDAADHLARVDTWKLLSKQFPNAPKQMVDMFLGQKVTLMKAVNGVSGIRAAYERALLALSVLVAMVLLIACVNVANLMTGQVAARAREMAVRVSLGAGRARLIRLVMVESAMVGVAAAGLGMLFAWWAAPFVVGRISNADMPIRLALEPDGMVMVFGVALTVGVTVLFGMIPAMRASRVRPVSALKGGEEPRGGVKWMQGMVAAQVAFCFVVLFAAMLFMGTLERLQTKPLGFSAERILLVDASSEQPQPEVKWEMVAEQMRAAPGVERVSLAGGRLLDMSFTTTFVTVNGEPASKVPAYTRHISPGLLETMKIPLLTGRDFTASDTNPGQAIVNEEFAKQYFDGVNPLGSRFSFATNGNGPLDKQGEFEVMGLVRNALYGDLRDSPPPTAYLPMHAMAKTGERLPLRYGVFVVRTKGAPSAMSETLRKIVKQAAPELHTGDLRTQQELIDTQTIRERLLASLGGFFGLVALLLATIGLYGVLHYSVVQREREIGIRIALGAAMGNIARLVTVRVFAMVLVGAVAGVALGVASVRYVSSLLYGVKGTDVSMMVLPGVVLLVAAGSAALPAVVRAVRIDPAIMLRAE